MAASKSGAGAFGADEGTSARVALALSSLSLLTKMVQVRTLRSNAEEGDIKVYTVAVNPRGFLLEDMFRAGRYPHLWHRLRR